MKEYLIKYSLRLADTSLFQDRSVTAPFTKALAEDEGIICQVEEIFDFGFNEK